MKNWKLEWAWTGGDGESYGSGYKYFEKEKEARKFMKILKEKYGKIPSFMILTYTQ